MGSQWVIDCPSCNIESANKIPVHVYVFGRPFPIDPFLETSRGRMGGRQPTVTLRHSVGDSGLGSFTRLQYWGQGRVKNNDMIGFLTETIG